MINSFITSWDDFIHASEEFDPETNSFKYTMIVAVEPEQSVLYAEIPVRKAELSLQRARDELRRLPDNEIFPKWPSPQDHRAFSIKISHASTDLCDSETFFVKRPKLSHYDVFKQHNVLSLLPQGLLEEAQTMEFLTQNPHPNIVKYHGCHSQRGYLTGIVLDRFKYHLEDYIKEGEHKIDTKVFIDALESAIRHLHSIGWAHNDLNPTNVMIHTSELGQATPVLIDFGSARKIGDALGTSRGTGNWIEGKIEDYHTSKREHDLFALEKIRYWLDNPSFDQ